MKLYRPTGLLEMALIYRSGMRAWPPRLPGQPIFYPVLNLAYAEQIAREWNATADTFAGYATSFEVEDGFCVQFQPQVVGGRQHLEFWVPAEQLVELNQRIVGSILVESTFFGRQFSGLIPTAGLLAGKDAKCQLRALIEAVSSGEASVDQVLSEANEAIFLNFSYWRTLHREGSTDDASLTARVLNQIATVWTRRNPRVKLPDYPGTLIDGAY